MRHLTLKLLCILLSMHAVAQSTFPVNGVFDDQPDVFALTGATIHVDPTTTLNNATILVVKGKIAAVGTDVSIPKGAVVQAMDGKHIYPSFIDLYTEYGLKPLEEPGGPYTGPQMETNKKGAYGWNQAIKPETHAGDIFKVDGKAAGAYRKAGFGTVLTHQNDGIARGTGALVTLANTKENEVMLMNNATAHYSFSKGVSTQDYPGSLMGSIALLQQTFYDADWYTAQGKDKEFNLSLQAWIDEQGLPQVFEVSNVLNLLRADLLGDQFKTQYIIKGSGDEYQKIDQVKATNAPLILPLNYPKAYDVEDPFDALNVSLADMKHWELAPANAAFLNQKGVKFCFTAADLEKMDDFLGNLRKAVEYGLPEAAALQALTTTPAELIGAEKVVGTLSKGKLANFLVTDTTLFAGDAKILQNWIKGVEYSLEKEADEVAGNYDLKVGDKTYYLTVTGDSKKADGKLKLSEQDSTDFKANISFSNSLVSITFKPEEDADVVRLSGAVDGNTWKGKAELPGGTWVTWSATAKAATAEEEPKKEEEKKEDETVTVLPTLKDVIYPFTAYGSNERPKQLTVLIKNATVWTNTDKGILENTDVLVSGGKIVSLGKNMAVKNADLVVDGTGKHLTSGIIDEHSHIAISSGVNEWTQASSAEVSIANVINSEDINIYRQLSGGVTAAQLLHGSANPIGGQSGIIKLRWGYTPEEMKFKEASPFIKFALGENVKQSNWGDYNTVRYPQTRMGVEQVFISYFERAKEYDKAWKAYNTLSSKQKKSANAPRRDVELETLAQILNGERFITCHSYVQSEINMLMKVADRFGFTLNTFTHILEGYKVADKMKEHGANASTFADWWAYKYEVIDAIPYNAAILNEMGVNTGINSDDAEMGRRLNQEAGKIVKYGGVSEEDAWKMVTLNPAKMLHLDEWVGSVAEGKHADLVLWSDHPLSIYAKAEQTYVDGMLMYDLKKDEALRKSIAAERSRLIQLMLIAKDGGSPTQKPVKKEQHLWHCDDLGDYNYHIYEQH